jgi:hypothetical protein
VKQAVGEHVVMVRCKAKVLKVRVYNYAYQAVALPNILDQSVYHRIVYRLHRIQHAG